MMERRELIESYSAITVGFKVFIQTLETRSE